MLYVIPDELCVPLRIFGEVLMILCFCSGELISPFNVSDDEFTVTSPLNFSLPFRFFGDVSAPESPAEVSVVSDVIACHFQHQYG